MIGVGVEWRWGVDDWNRLAALAARMRGVVACSEDAFGDPSSDGFLVSAESGGGAGPINAGPGDYDRLAEVANDGAGEGDVVFKPLLDGVRWIDDAAIVIDAGVRSANAEAPRAHGAGEGRCETSTRAVQGFEAVTADMSADEVPCFEQIMVDLVHRKNPPSTKGPTARSARAGLTSAQECRRMMGDVRRQRAI